MDSRYTDTIEAVLNGSRLGWADKLDSCEVQILAACRKARKPFGMVNSVGNTETGNRNKTRHSAGFRKAPCFLRDMGLG